MFRLYYYYYYINIIILLLCLGYCICVVSGALRASPGTTTCALAPGEELPSYSSYSYMQRGALIEMGQLLEDILESWKIRAKAVQTTLETCFFPIIMSNGESQLPRGCCSLSLLACYMPPSTLIYYTCRTSRASFFFLNAAANQTAREPS